MPKSQIYYVIVRSDVELLGIGILNHRGTRKKRVCLLSRKKDLSFGNFGSTEKSWNCAVRAGVGRKLIPPLISLAGQLPGCRLGRSSFRYTVESVLQITL